MPYHSEPDTKKESRGGTLLKAGLFLAIFLALFVSVSKLLTSPGDSRNYQWIHGFYEEKEDSLDGVYIGSSGVYAYWQAALGWNSHGIAIWPYASNAMPLAATRIVLEEVHKTQPDALKIIYVPYGDITNDCSVSKIHWLVDYMPWSMMKIKLINSLCDICDIKPAGRLEFYIPLYRYHSRWDELVKEDFSYELDGTKGGSQYESFLKKEKDVSSYYREFDRAGKLTEESETYFTDLFDYIEEAEIPVLFIANTALTKSENDLAEINRVMDLAEERGLHTLNLKNELETVEIDTKTDYYNNGHTNVHGSIKYTEFLSNYLVENYGFQDKRGKDGYESWNDAVEKYTDVLAPYVVEEELDCGLYDSSLPAPELTSLNVNGNTLTLNWKGVKGADGYHIYRKDGISEPWHFLVETSEDILSYSDEGLEVLKEYTYTVLPQKEQNGQQFHGKYEHAGITATTLPNTPKLLELSGDSQEQTLKWEKVSGADGYYIYRKLAGRSWINIADVEKTTYTDQNLFGGNFPLLYSVMAYVEDDEGNRTSSAYDTSGLLYLPQIKDIDLSVIDEDGRITLSWNPVMGAARYYIERMAQGGEWISLAEPTTVTSFTDITADSNIPYRYRVTAALTYRKQEYRYATQETKGWAQSTEDSMIVDRPEIVFAQQIGTGVNLVWTPAQNAAAYRVYRKTDTTDWAVLAASVVGNVYTDSKLPQDAEETAYLVQALYGPKGLVFCGEFSQDAAVTVDLRQEE